MYGGNRYLRLSFSFPSKLITSLCLQVTQLIPADPVWNNYLLHLQRMISIVFLQKHNGEGSLAVLSFLRKKNL